MSDPISGVSRGGEETASIEFDTPCRKCGYNLRGLNPAGRCPECGTPVGFSVYGGLLRYSYPSWLRTLQRGASMILWSCVVIIVGSIAGGAAQTTGSGYLPGVVAVFLGNLLSLVGAWYLTTPDPSGLGEDQYGTSRRLIRVTLIIGAINTAINIPMSMFLPPTFLIMPWHVIQGVAGIAGVVGLLAELQYLGKLADRIPDPKLSSRANFLKYALPSSYLVIILGGIGVFFLLRNAPPVPTGPVIPLQAFACFFIFAFLTLLIFGVMYLFLISRMGRRFKEQAALAETTWRESGPNPDPAN